MADAPEPPAEAADEPADAAGDEPVEPPAAATGAPRARSTRRRLDARTVLICGVISLLAALGAAFLVTLVTDDDGATVDPDRLSLLEESAADGDGVSDVDIDALLGLRVFDADGEPATLDQLRGEGRTLVNFWQSACVPCVEEMPLLQAASEANPDVAFLGANTQETDEAAAVQLLERTGVTYPTFGDPEGNLYAATGLGGLPATVLLGPDGAVLATELGAFSDADELQSFLDRHPA